MKKSLIAFTLLLIAVTAAQAAEVRLQYAKDVSFTLAHARVIHQIEAQVVVANLAFEKQVTAVYSVDGGVWKETRASFVKSLDGANDLFVFAIPMGESDYNSGNYNSRSVRFALRYEVAGQTYWDNNGGRDYRIATKGKGLTLPRVLLGTANVLLMGHRSHAVAGAAGDTWYFEGQIAVRNLGYGKRVNVVYSLDNWQTVRVAPAAYSGTQGEAEVWVFSAIDGYVPDARYSIAVSCEVNGQTWWDNWQGNNYHLGWGGWIGMDLWFQ